jgi:hypothetical protein
MNNYRNKIGEIAMMMDLRTVIVVILAIKIEIVHVLNTAVCTRMDSVQVASQ